jgi:hypothetical protein|tara:strand:+ start:612 stop:845 length:234 start_codon:yes stop_codon:yes gene_type:complete
MNSVDAITDVDDDDYFLEVADEVRAGDGIHVCCVATGTRDNPTTNTSVSDVIVVEAVGAKDGGTATVTTFDTAKPIA